MDRILRGVILIPLLWICRLWAQGVGGAEQWTRASSTVTADLNAATAASSGLFLAAGSGGTLVRSTDAIHWTAESSGTSQNLYGIVASSSSAGGALYVAVGAAGTIVTSTDGVIWTVRSSGTAANLRAVAYGSSFLAVGDGGAAVTSKDGITWSTFSFQTSADLSAVAAIVPIFDNNASGFVIAGAAGTVIDDGAFGGVLQTGTSAHFTAIAALQSGLLIFGVQGAVGEVRFPRIDFAIPDWELGTPTFAGDYAAASSVQVSGVWYAAALGRTGAVWVSGNAIPVVQLPTGVNYSGIALSSSTAVVVGQEGTIWTNAPSAPGLSNSAPPVSGLSATGVQFVGQSITLSVPAVAGALYQWLFNGSPIAGATTASLPLSDLQSNSGGVYSATVTTAALAVTSTATLNVKPIADYSPSLVDLSFIGGSQYAPNSLTLLSGGKVVFDGNTVLNSDGSVAGSASFGEALQVIPQPDGKWIDVGYTSIARFNSDGSLDPTFVVDSTQLFAARLTLLPNGKWLLFNRPAGSGSVTWRKLNADGSVDPSFGQQSIAIADAEGVTSTSVDAQGRVYVAVVSGAQSEFAESPTTVLRLDSNYAVDPGFTPQSGLFSNLTVTNLQAVPVGLIYVAAKSGPGIQMGLLTSTGAAAGNYPAKSLNYTAVLFPQSDGTVLALIPSQSMISQACFNLERFDASGQIDPGYGGRFVGTPSATTPLATPVSGMSVLLPLPNGQMLVGGTFTSLNFVPTVNVARITPDTDFAATCLLNASVRAEVTPAQPLLLAGYLNGGSAAGMTTVNFLVRAVGPALAAFGVPNFLPDPHLTLSSAAMSLGSNSGWSSPAAANSSLGGLFQAVGAFSLGVGSADAALAQPLTSGPFYSQISSPASSGIALAEAYYAGPSPTSSSQLRVSNFSCLDSTSAGAGQLTLGFVVAGNDVKTLLIRAVGPGLSAVNVSGPAILAQPVLSLYQGANLIASNTSLATVYNEIELLNDSVQVGAFTLPPQGLDSALLVTLPAGAYTAVASGKNGTSGEVLLEVYEVP